MKIQLDENNYFTGNYAIIGDVPNSVEVESITLGEDLVKQKAYKYENGSLVFDEERYQELVKEQQEAEEKQAKEQKIMELQKELDDTDYKIIKCQEYSLAGLELPYDIEELHTQRQALRDEINKLQEELN